MITAYAVSSLSPAITWRNYREQVEHNAGLIGLGSSFGYVLPYEHLAKPPLLSV